MQKIIRRCLRRMKSAVLRERDCYVDIEYVVLRQYGNVAAVLMGDKAHRLNAVAVIARIALACAGKPVLKLQLAGKIIGAVNDDGLAA